MDGHFATLGKSLGRAVEAFNGTLGSLETRVFPAARKLPQLGVSADSELASVEPIDVAVRIATAPEFVDGDGARTRRRRRLTTGINGRRATFNRGMSDNAS